MIVGVFVFWPRFPLWRPFAVSAVLVALGVSSFSHLLNSLHCFLRAQAGNLTSLLSPLAICFPGMMFLCGEVILDVGGALQRFRGGRESYLAWLGAPVLVVGL